MSVLEELCKEHAIKISSVFLGRTHDKEWDADRFLVTLGRGAEQIEVTFNMGSGHRIVGRNVSYEFRKYVGKPIPYNVSRAIRSRLEKYTKEVPPTAVMVLSYLISDAYCGQGSFEGFCSDFGCDTDSRKAIETYLACQENGMQVKRLLGNLYDTFIENNDY